MADDELEIGAYDAPVPLPVTIGSATTVTTVVETKAAEMERILEEQKVEQTWWDDKPNMETEEDIEKAVKNGYAVRVTDDISKGYKISAKTREEFRVLERNTATLLNEVGERWLAKLKAKNLDDGKTFLVISSLARTTEFQQKLIAEGYPAAEKSTHTRLGAFDIAIAWFRANKPEVLDLLTEVLDELVQEKRINFIEEPDIGAYHVAWNPWSIQ